MDCIANEFVSATAMLDRVQQTAFPADVFDSESQCTMPSREWFLRFLSIDLLGT
eukprot:m.490197 g.490197  ORF g.490197 m.490197 type:complete len:54 (-) comp57248_c0_seq1:2300-2461(-)